MSLRRSGLDADLGWFVFLLRFHRDDISNGGFLNATIGGFFWSTILYEKLSLFL